MSFVKACFILSRYPPEVNLWTNCSYKKLLEKSQQLCSWLRKLPQQQKNRNITVPAKEIAIGQRSSFANIHWWIVIDVLASASFLKSVRTPQANWNNKQPGITTRTWQVFRGRNPQSASSALQAHHGSKINRVRTKLYLITQTCPRHWLV